MIQSIIVVIFLASALKCKVCEENDPTCVFGHNGNSRQCENDDDECFSWFHRSGKFSEIKLNVIISVN